jgi:hypothetical protein
MWVRAVNGMGIFFPSVLKSLKLSQKYRTPSPRNTVSFDETAELYSMFGYTDFRNPLLET